MGGAMLPGTRIRYTLDYLGLIGQVGRVDAGEEGTVIGPAPDEGWLYTEPDNHPQAICPVHESMVEEVKP